MPINLLIKQLLKDGLERHRFYVDSSPAEPLLLDGMDLICKLARKPPPKVGIEIYLAFNGFEQSDLKSGIYHLDADVLTVEASADQWRVALRFNENEESLGKRQNDRLRVHQFAIRIRRSGEATQEWPANVQDLSPDGMGIRREFPLNVGEVLDVLGLAEATGLEFPEAVPFQVRALPNSTKAGLLLAPGNSTEAMDLFAALFVQLKQIQRFWQSQLDNIRLTLGMATQKGALLSAEFACRQLRDRPIPRRLLISDEDFESVTQYLAELTRLDRIQEEIAILEADREWLLTKAPASKVWLKGFLNRLEG